MNSKEILKRLKQAGWKEVRQNGSHIILRHPDHPTPTIVPHPKQDMPIGTLKNIQKQSGVRLT